jgi:hypothetical protein
VVARDGRVVVDTAARLPGRGAWVHPVSGCVQNAIQRKALGRALRVTITELSAFEKLADLDEWAEKTMDN